MCSFFVAQKGPLILDPPKDQTATEGGTAKFTARITGEPEPTVTWSKDHRELFESKRYKMKYTDAVASLVIYDVVERDIGRYKVEARNAGGFASAYALLNLECE